jgi:CBS domain containing-hemolysin-like protein
MSAFFESNLNLILLLASFVALLLLSAIFSALQSAFLSFSEIEEKEFSEKRATAAQRVLFLLRNKRSFLMAVRGVLLLANVLLITVVLFLSLAVAAKNALPWGYGVLAGVGLSVLLLFFLDEIWANLIVLSNNQEFAEALAGAATMFYNLTRPFAKIAANIFRKIAHRFDVAHKRDFLHRQKIMATIVEEGEEIADLKDSERAMIHSIFEFGDTEVYEIMAPRTDMVCVEENATLDELIKIIHENQHSRLPLYRGGIDQILGIIHVKDLLSVIKNPPEKLELKKLARPAYFVPENKKLHNLLRDFQQTKSHMAIVVDEYGGTSGLVTLEDVIEQIVGEIQDEYDEEQPLYRKLDANTFLIDAKIDLHELNEKLNFDLPTEGEFETLGGFILSLTGHVPSTNEVVKYDGYTFIIEKIERNRILWVQLKKETPAADGRLALRES